MAAKRKGLTTRTNEAGKGFFDIWYQGGHYRIYTGKSFQGNESWFAARETLLGELLDNRTFELEQAKAMIGVAPQRRARPERTANLTVQEFGQEWLQHKETVVSRDKLYEYGLTLKIICETAITLPGPRRRPLLVGSLPLKDLRAQHVDVLVNALRQRPGMKGPILRASRLKDMLGSVLRPLLVLAYERGYVPQNPQDWVPKRRAERPDDIDPFSFDEVVRLLAAFPAAKWVRYYTVAFGTGLRPSEQTALQWPQIDFLGKVIQVRQGWVRGHLTPLKTAGSHRDVEMLPMVEEALRAQAAERRSAYVFPDSRGGALFQEGLRLRIWGPTLQRAGLRHRNHYQTRHTFATLMLSQGEEIAWVARMMGHVNTRTVIERYYKYIPRRTRQDGAYFTTAFQAAQIRQPSVDHP